MKNALRILLLFVTASSLWAATSEPLLPFLKLSDSARQSSLGSAYTAMYAEADAVGVNPAGIYGIKGFNGYLTYFGLFEGFKYFSGFVGQDFSFGTLGIHVIHFGASSDDGTVFNASGDLVPSGESIDSSSNAFSVTYAHSFFWDLAIGASAKVVMENFSSTPFTTVAFDVGAQKRFFRNRFIVGASILNLGPGKTRTDGTGFTDPLPILGRLGLGYLVLQKRNHQVMVLADLTGTRAEPYVVHLGAEYNLFRYAYFRIGYEPNALHERFSFGVGAKYGRGKMTYAADYGLRTHDEFGASNKVTLKAVYDWDTVRRRVKKREKAPQKKKLKFGLANVPLSWDHIIRMVSDGSEDYVRVIQKDGTETVGKLESVLPEKMELTTLSGETKEIPKENVIIMFQVLDPSN